MARKKISEFSAKRILHEFLNLPYDGVSFQVTTDNRNKLDSLDPNKNYVLKVDEGIKKRMKNGLVVLNKKPTELFSEVQKLHKKGYTHFIIEPFLVHDTNSEKYLSVGRVREGLQILYSEKGGIDIEENAKSIKAFLITDMQKSAAVTKELRLGGLDLSQLIELFNNTQFSFLEINPLVVLNESFHFLDVAAEVDSSGAFFVDDRWTSDDFRSGDTKEKMPEEDTVATLSQKSQASFALTVLNPDGGIGMLLSGGGASIVLADEVYNLGFGQELANYGEYSGNPNAEEVSLYTTQIVSLLLKSKAKKKVLVIAGGVANFTDIRITFSGIIEALDAVKEQLRKQNIHVFVRRGGPHQEEGLLQMETFLQTHGLLGFVGDQKTALPEIIRKAVKTL